MKVRVKWVSRGYYQVPIYFVGCPECRREMSEEVLVNHLEKRHDWGRYKAGTTVREAIDLDIKSR